MKNGCPAPSFCHSRAKWLFFWPSPLTIPRECGRLFKSEKFGPVAQLGERSVRIREVKGSNPSRSTNSLRRFLPAGAFLLRAGTRGTIGTFGTFLSARNVLERFGAERSHRSKRSKRSQRSPRSERSNRSKRSQRSWRQGKGKKFAFLVRKIARKRTHCRPGRRRGIMGTSRKNTFVKGDTL